MVSCCFKSFCFDFFDEDSGIAVVFCNECLNRRSILQRMSQNTVTAKQTMDNSMSQTILKKNK